MNNLKKILITAGCIIVCCSVYGCESERNSENSAEFSASPAQTEISEEYIVTETSAETEQAVTDLTEPLVTDSILNAAPANFPVLDGSTSAIPLDAAIRAAYLGGFTADEIEPYITHSKTYKAFSNLINGSADAIFTVPLSEDQIKEAEENNFKYEMIPVSKEAFVFVVNASNPVDSLTQEQLRKIYSGEIRNWSEVGGNDAEIKLFTRNEKSGSGSYFSEFMGDTPAAEGEYVYKIGAMSKILATLASYDNGPDAIGYSVFSYVTEMYDESDNLKMIAVDGIPADKSTVAGDEYPLLSCTYFMFSADEPEDSEVRKIADFITSEKGQDAVESAGYIRIS